MKKLILVLVILLITPNIIHAEKFKKRLFVDITNPNIKKLPIAILNFTNNGSEKDSHLINSVKKTLSFDLDVSGIMRVIPTKAFLTQSINIKNFKTAEWRMLGANGVIATHYKITNNTVKFEFRLFDVASGKLVVGKRYSGTRNNGREIAHMFANEIMKYYTGELGSYTTKIAFVSNKTGNKEIYIMDYDGHNIRQITHNKSINLHPSWSPDNTKLVYTSFKSGKPDIWMVNLRTMKHRRLTRLKNLTTGATWHPDGKHIVFASSHARKDGDTDLYIMDTGTKRMVRLTHSRGIDISPAITKDGKKIAFVSGRSGQPHIFTMDFNGRNLKRITYAGRYNATPAWSPDGKKIMFAGWDKANFDLFMVNSDATNMERLTKFTRDNEEPTFSPDGRMVMYHSTRRGNRHKSRSDLILINANGLGERTILKDFGMASSPDWSNRF